MVGLLFNIFNNQSEDGKHGQLPNMDILVLFSTALGRRGLDVTFCKSVPHFEATQQSSYVDNFWRLGNMIVSQALEISHGPHRAFKQFGIDAISIFTFQSASKSGVHNVHTMAYALESGFVSLNNLIERLHHSVFFYIALTPSDMIHFSTYIIIPILMHIAVIISGLSMWLNESSQKTTENSKWAQNTQVDVLTSAVAFVVSFLIGALIYIVPVRIINNF